MALAVWFREDIAAAIVAVLVASGKDDSHDLQAVAAAFGIPWQVVMGIYWQQVGEVVEVER